MQISNIFSRKKWKNIFFRGKLIVIIANIVTHKPLMRELTNSF